MNERVCYLRIKHKFFNISILNVHAPIKNKEEHIKEGFYEIVERRYDSRPRNDIKILIGDFNVQMGREQLYWEHAGRYSRQLTFNDNGNKLMNFTASRYIYVDSTKFVHKIMERTRWQCKKSNRPCTYR